MSDEEEESRDFLSFLPQSPGKRGLVIALGLVVLILLCLVLALVAMRMRPKPATPTLEAPIATATETPEYEDTPTLEDTPTPEATLTQPAPISIDFNADRTQLPPGRCANVYWAVRNADMVFLDDQLVDPSGQRTVCPKPGQVYTLRATGPAGEETRQVVFQVSEALCEVVYALAPGMNVRAGPGQAYDPPIALLQKGTVLRPLAFNPRGNPDFPWVKVESMDRGMVGWVRAGPEFLKCDIDVSTLPFDPGPPLNTPTPTRKAPTATATFTRTPSPRPAGQIIPMPGAHPNVIALDPQNGRIYVTGRDSNSLWVIDEARLAVITQVPVGNQPYGVAYLAGTAYVANFGSASITLVDTAKLTVVDTIDLRAREIGTEPTFPTVYAPPTQSTVANIPGLVAVPLHGNGRLMFISPLRYAVSSGVNVGNLFPTVPGSFAGTFGIATLNKLERIYVSNRDRFSVIAINVPKQQPLEAVSLLKLEGSPYFLASNQKTWRLYLTHAGAGRPADQPDRLSVYEASDLPTRRLNTIQVGALGNAGGYVAIWPPDGSSWADTVWVSVDKQVVVYGPDLERVLATYGADAGIGPNPYGIAINPQLKRVYVADGDGDKVTVLTVR